MRGTYDSAFTVGLQCLMTHAWEGISSLGTYAMRANLLLPCPDASAVGGGVCTEGAAAAGCASSGRGRG